MFKDKANLLKLAGFTAAVAAAVSAYLQGDAVAAVGIIGAALSSPVRQAP